MKKIVIFCLSIILCESANAGLKDLTIHSRANCINNETISWQAGVSHKLFTRSSHYYNGTLQHVIETGWQVTWRSAAVHWGEGTGGWVVLGEHYAWHPLNSTYSFLGYTHVNNCSIYDGWWD